jgi:ATP-binding protein involved in chromosome partitioning
MADITKSEILSTLKRIDDKNINTDFLILNSIKEYESKGNKLNLTISVPAGVEVERMKESFTRAIENEFKDLKKIEINLESKSASSQEPKNESVLPGVKNTIAVASGKGGVGKSTVAVNLAVALAKNGAKVGIIDADIYGPSIPLMLGINKKPQIFQSRETMKMIPLVNYGIKIISIGFLIDDNAPVIWRGPMASGAVKQFMTDVDWDKLDYLVFDMPPGTGDIQLTLVQTIPLTGAVIVTTPQEVSLVDARKALKMFGRVNVPVLGIVENMSYFIAPDTGKKYDIFGNGGGQALAESTGTPFLGGIPIDPRIRIGGDKGIPIVYDMPDSEHSDAIMKIAKNLDKQVNSRDSQSDSKVEIILDNDD